MEAHCSAEFRGDSREVPARGVLEMLVDVAGCSWQYADPVVPADRPMVLLDLGRGDAIGAGEHRPEDGREPAPRALSTPHERPAGGRLHERGRVPRVRMAVGEETTV